jgi:Ca2+-binding EF-hand superfamily protein
MLEDNLRSKVDYMWDDLRKEFLGLDVYGTGFVSKEEFRDVLQELCVHLSPYELDALCSKFEIKHDGRVSYVEFLKPFALRKQTHRYGNNMLTLLTHPQAEVPIAPIVNEPVKGLSGITARLRQRLVGDWRTLRRAFKKMDLGHTGYLSLPEFRNVLRLCNMVLDEDEVYHVMSEFDEKMDGKINYNKFLTDTFNADVNAP